MNELTFTYGANFLTIQAVRLYEREVLEAVRRTSLRGRMIRHIAERRRAWDIVLSSPVLDSTKVSFLREWFFDSAPRLTIGTYLNLLGTGGIIEVVPDGDEFPLEYEGGNKSLPVLTLKIFSKDKLQ
jgi:hypothetical protein